MNDPFIINYSHFNKTEEEALFVEAITSNFVSKKVRENTYVIVNNNKLTPKEIHTLLLSKLKFDVSFTVINLRYFFGAFNKEGIKWLKDTFPDSNLREYDKTD